MTNTTLLGTTLRQRIRNWLGTQKIWNLQLAVYAAIAYALANVSYDSLRLNSFKPEWLPIWIGTYLESIAIVALLLFLAPKSLWRQPKSGVVANLVIAAITGAIKNSTVYWWALAAGLETSTYDPLVRIAGGALLSGGILFSWVSLTASRFGHRDLMLELRGKQRDLLSYRDSVKQRVSSAQAELVNQTKQTLLPKLEVLESRLSSSSEAHVLVGELQHLIEADVRPLSRAFEQEARSLSSAPNPKTLDPEARRVFPKQFKIRENLPPLGVLMWILPLNAITTYMLFGTDSVIPVALSGLMTVAMIFFWRLFWPKERMVRRWVGLLSLSVGSALVGLPQAVFVHEVIEGQPGQTDLLIFSLYGQTVLGFWLTAYLNILDEARIDLEAQMISVNENLNHELAVFRQALWLQKRRWSYLLHGTVQATLTAAIARLSSLTNSTLEGANRTTEGGMIRQLVQQDLRKIADAIKSPPDAEVNLERELHQLQQTWSGVLEISYSISARAMRAIEKSANLRMSLNEICRESATNAFRHGRANILKIAIERPTDNELSLTITNNGDPVSSQAKGLGLQMFDALTLEWHWAERRTTALTVMSARLPVAIG